MRLHFIILFSLFSISSLNAVDGVWTGATDSSWNTAGNWTGGNIAGVGGNVGDNATFNNAASPATVDTAVDLGTLIADAANAFTINSSGSTLSVDQITQSQAQTLTINGPSVGSTFFSFGTNPGTIYFGAAGTVRFTNMTGGNTNNVQINGNGTVVLNGATIPGFKAGTVYVNNTATLQYTGSTSFSNSALSTNIVLANGATLDLTDTLISFNPTISGAGSVRSNSTLAILTGANSYTGGTTILGGTLNGTTSTIPGDTGYGVTITAGTLEFKQLNLSGTYAGVITGGGDVNIGQGANDSTGQVTLSKTNTYTGDTRVLFGTLSVTGSIGSTNSVAVSSGATLTGSGTVRNVTNSGTVTAGLTSAHTLTVNGTFTQQAGSKLKIRVDPVVSSVLAVQGVANLQGTLELVLTPGVYPEGTSLTVLTAGGGLGGSTFTTFTDSDDTRVWKIAYTANAVRVSLSAGGGGGGGGLVVTRFPINSLPLNPRHVANYYFQNPIVANSTPDLTLVANATIALLTEEGFADSLLRLSPLSQNGLTSTTTQNDFQMAIAIDKQFQTTTNKHRRKKKQAKLRQIELDETLCYGIPQTGAFIQPVGIFYNQQQTTDALASTLQIPFFAYTYGAGLGYEYVIDNQFVFEGGVGYTHSNLNWKKNFGNARWSSLYFAPFFGWFNEVGFANIMVMGAFNFYDTKRKIQFPGINRVAKSRYYSYDVLVRANGGGRIFMGGDIWVQPEATMNFLSVFTQPYKEHGAGGVSLQVRRQINYILQPSFRFRIIEEFLLPEFCLAPNIYVGWLANIPIGNGNTTARFIQGPANLFFNIQGSRQTTNQLVLGAEFYLQRFKTYEFTTNFEADLLSKFEIYTVKLKFEWFF